jgi:SPP1 gp7 family putative phage head morphogenesis protein
MAAQKPFVRKIHSGIGKVLAKWRHKLLNELPDAMPNRAVGSTVNKGIVGTIFDVSQFIADIRASVEGNLAKTLIPAGNLSMEEFGDGASFGPRPEWVAEFIRSRSNFITGAAKSDHERILRHVEEGIDSGETMDDIADRVRGIFQACDRSSAMVIAQTETATAFSHARDASMHQAGVTHKEWLSSQDERVRDSHQEADGQIVGLDEDFTVNGIRMAHPHAEGAPASEVINCRCITIAALKSQE